MYSVLKSYGLNGLNGFAVAVEADVSGGLPAFSLVGLPDSAVRESGDRVRSAVKNLGYKWPDRHITVNLAPADIRKSGPVYDLPLLLAVLASSGQMEEPPADAAFLGELALDGSLRPVSGVLPMALAAAADGIRSLYVPAENAAEALDILQDMLDEGSTVAVGGSMSLFEAGVIDELRAGEYHFLDRYEKGLSREQIKQIFRDSFSADAYITSTNAITEDGELYNVDGNGNRVAAMLYGPDSVIVLAGYNKIVKNLDEAKARVEAVAAPANAVRLSTETPCRTTGMCMHCRSEDRICADYVVMSRQRTKDRIKVILVAEELGY